MGVMQSIGSGLVQAPASGSQQFPHGWTGLGSDGSAATSARCASAHENMTYLPLELTVDNSPNRSATTGAKRFENAVMPIVSVQEVLSVRQARERRTTYRSRRQNRTQ